MLIRYLFLLQVRPYCARGQNCFFPAIRVRLDSKPVLMGLTMETSGNLKYSTDSSNQSVNFLRVEMGKMA